MASRNPSPPHEYGDASASADKIGNTAYSKRWLYSVLMRVIELSSTELECVKETEGVLPGTTTVKDLPSELEEQLCCLWDLTVNRDVLPYLTEFHISSVLMEVLHGHHYPRLSEIAVGILANLAFDKDECQQMSENDIFINRVISLFYSHDAPTLTEVCRLLQTVLASDECGSHWLVAVQFQSDFFENILFILKSSTNANLLIATVRLIDAITRGDDSLAEEWCGSELLEGILIAQHEMKWLHGNEVEVIHRLFYTFSSNVNGVTALMKAFDQLLPTLGVYLRRVCEDEPHLMPFSVYYNSLRAIVPVIDAVAASFSPTQAVSCFSSDKTVLPALVTVIVGCQQQLEGFPLVRGVLADLCILFKDVIQAVDSALQDSGASPGSCTMTIDSLLLSNLEWLFELENDPLSSKREGFITCYLNDGDSKSRQHLISVCNRIKLPKLLESLTDD